MFRQHLLPVAFFELKTLLEVATEYKISQPFYYFLCVSNNTVLCYFLCESKFSI